MWLGILVAPVAGYFAHRWRRTVLDLARVARLATEQAHVQPGDVVLDLADDPSTYALGCLPAVGPTGRVIFAGHGEYAQRTCQAFIDRTDWAARAEFVTTDVSRPVPPLRTPADVVVSCISLHRLTALDGRDLFTALKPGGRLSVAQQVPTKGRGQPLAEQLVRAGFHEQATDPMDTVSSGAWCLVAATKPS